MTYSVIWLPEAESTFKQNLDYLSDEWPTLIKANFLVRVDEVISLISTNPNLYPIYRKKDQVRKCVVHPRIALYFKVKKEKIYLIVFWNSYQDPKKLKLKI
jgi:hypothetical protein